MAEENNVASSSRPKKPKSFEDVRNSSNVRWSSCRPTHQFVFSNTVDDPIKVEEMEDPSKDSEQRSAYGEEALNKDDYQDISSAPDEIKTTEGSLDEKATTTEEGQYEDTSHLTPSPDCS